MFQAGLSGEETSGAQHSQWRLPDPHLIPYITSQSSQICPAFNSHPDPLEDLPPTFPGEESLQLERFHTDKVDDEHTNIMSQSFSELEQNFLKRPRLRQKVTGCSGFNTSRWTPLVEMNPWKQPHHYTWEWLLLHRDLQHFNQLAFRNWFWHVIV